MHTQFCIAHRIGLSYSLFFESATFLSEPTMQSCVLHLSWNFWILPTVKKLQCQHHVNLSSQKIHWAIIGCRTCTSQCFELTLRLLQTFDFYSCTVYFCCSCCNVVCFISLALRSGNYWFVFYVVDFFCVHLAVQIESSPLAEPFPQALICIFASTLTLTYIYNATMSNTKERDMINPLSSRNLNLDPLSRNVCIKLYETKSKFSPSA